MTDHASPRHQPCGGLSPRQSALQRRFLQPVTLGDSGLYNFLYGNGLA